MCEGEKEWVERKNTWNGTIWNATVPRQCQTVCEGRGEPRHDKVAIYKEIVKANKVRFMFIINVDFIFIVFSRCGCCCCCCGFNSKISVPRSGSRTPVSIDSNPKSITSVYLCVWTRVLCVYCVYLKRTKNWFSLDHNLQYFVKHEAQTHNTQFFHVLRGSLFLSINIFVFFFVSYRNNVCCHR